VSPSCKNFSVEYNDVIFKPQLWVVQGHWKWLRSTDHIQQTIGEPF